MEGAFVTEENDPVDVIYRVGETAALPLASWRQAGELVEAFSRIEFTSSGDSSGYRRVAWSSTSGPHAHLSLGVKRGGRTTITVADHGDGTIGSLIIELSAFLVPLDQINGLESTLRLSLVIAPDQPHEGARFPSLADVIAECLTENGPDITPVPRGPQT
jgi:hypothetical protein